MLRSDVQRRILQHLCLLVDILAFADKYTAEIEVAHFACTPDMIESLLASVTLAEIEGQFVLGRADFTQYVVISLPLEKSVANSWVAIVGSIVEWCPLAMILSID